MNRITKVAALAAVGVTAAIATGTLASAGVTVDATGHGFVGKGDIQSAMGWNNDALQRNAATLSFTIKQPASQALTQDATQTATETATQTGTQTVTQTGTQAATK